MHVYHHPHLPAHATRWIWLSFFLVMAFGLAVRDVVDSTAGSVIMVLVGVFALAALVRELVRGYKAG